jgi:hypothetical protein
VKEGVGWWLAVERWVVVVFGMMMLFSYAFLLIDLKRLALFWKTQLRYRRCYEESPCRTDANKDQQLTSTVLL